MHKEHPNISHKMHGIIRNAHAHVFFFCYYVFAYQSCWISVAWLMKPPVYIYLVSNFEIPLICQFPLFTLITFLNSCFKNLVYFLSFVLFIPPPRLVKIRLNWQCICISSSYLSLCLLVLKSTKHRPYTTLSYM